MCSPLHTRTCCFPPCKKLKSVWFKFFKKFDDTRRWNDDGSMDGILLWPISGTFLRFFLVKQIKIADWGSQPCWCCDLVEKWWNTCGFLSVAFDIWVKKLVSVNFAIRYALALRRLRQWVFVEIHWCVKRDELVLDWMWESRIPSKSLEESPNIINWGKNRTLEWLAKFRACLLGGVLVNI